MNSGATAERVYDALKAQIQSGTILPGDKLDPASFAEQLNSSVTPVRDALHRLAGERLVETRISEGFHLPIVTEPALRDLYEWNAQLIRLIAQAWRRGTHEQHADALPADIGRATRTFFDLFPARSDNAEHASQVEIASDLLAAPRVAETRVLHGLEAEIRAMAVSFDADGTGPLLKLVSAYHRRRLQATPDIVRALYRN